MCLKIIHLIICINIYLIGFSIAQARYSISYVRTSTDKSFKEIYGDSNLKFTSYEKGKTFFKPSETYWIKIEWDKKSELSNVVVLFGTPISKIECFSFDKKNVLKYQEAGINVAYQNQIIRTGDKNKIYLNFQVKDNMIYLKIRNELLFKYDLDKLEINPLNEWVLNKEKQHLFQGFFVGVVVILVLISLLYKISAIKYINYYYIAYILSNLVLFMFLNEYTVEYFFFKKPRVDLSLMVSMHFASLFFIQFARYFFKTGQILSRVDTVAKNYIKVSIIAVFCLLIISYFDFSIYSYLAIIIEIFNQLIGLMIISFAFRKTDIIGKLIIVGSFISTLDVFYMLYNNHIVELSTRNLNIYQTGYMVEILFIIIAIKLRYSQFEKEQQVALVKNATLESESRIKGQENLILKKENDIALLKEQLLRQEINKKDKELAVNMMQLTHRDQILDNLHEKMKKLLPGTTGINKKELSEIIQSLNHNQKDSFWKEFDIYFEQMHNGFFGKLSKQYPALTQSEKRLCAFLKVGMSSKEIGSLTQKSYKSIEVFRSRIRKKLGLNMSINLTDYLNKI
jgi:hypothetical protein